MSQALVIAVIGAPPAATTPTNANCEAPENMRRLSSITDKTSSPAATPIAPKEIP